MFVSDPNVTSYEKTDFWRNSGFHLLDRTQAGNLLVTDDFLRAYYLRPEVCPLEESSDLEWRLHEDLMDNPRMGMSSERLASIEDEDVRDNYRFIFDFRERLLASNSLEDCYLNIFSNHPRA